MTDTTLKVVGTKLGDITLVISDPWPSLSPSHFTISFGRGPSGLNPITVNRVGYHGDISVLKSADSEANDRVTRSSIYRSDWKSDPSPAAIKALGKLAFEVVTDWLASPDGKDIISRFSRRNLPIVRL